MNREQINELMDAALEGTITEADFLRLEAALSVDPATRQEYYDRVRLSTMLESEAQSLLENVEHEPSAVVQRGSESSNDRWRWAFLAMSVVCTALVVLIARPWFWPTQGNSSRSELASGNASVEPESSGFAIVAGQSEAVWDGNLLAPGSVVPPGELHLKSGVAQFELFSGVTLVVEGDARFSILSPMEVSVAYGKVRARVPEPAQGFRVLTANGRVVDLGTEFAVNVGADSAEVHVIEGEVEWHVDGAPVKRLEGGAGTRSSSGTETEIEARANAFVGATELRERLQRRQQSRYDAWRDANSLLSNDSRLLAHFQVTTAQTARRRLVNLAVGQEDRVSEGAVVAAKPTTNRWNQTESALDFSPAGSRVRLHVPGTHQHLTLICWVKINSLDRWYNSLFLTDGHEKGEPHWQIMDDGRLFFSVKKNDVWNEAAGEKDKHIFYSPPFWDRSLSGRWIMLATVYDGTQREVTHYLNGRVLSREAIPAEYLVSEIGIGDASLGNWGLPEQDQPRFAIRNLNGSLDEFLMFRMPLGEDEIEQLYRVGSPE